MRRFTAIVATLIVMTAWTSTALAQDASTPAPDATPSPIGTSGLVLLTEDQVPNGLVIIMDGDRTLDDVVANFTDPTSAKAQFEEWGWQRNVVRGFNVPDGTSLDPLEIDGFYISVHEFDDSSSAMDALDFTFATHIAGTEFEEIDTEPNGDYSRTLCGEVSYGQEVTFYVQRGELMIRFSASSPEGDPREEAEAVLRLMLESQTSGS